MANNKADKIFGILRQDFRESIMETEKKKMTDNQLRLVQGIAGILSAAALMVSISLSSILPGLLAYLFVAVFLVITMGRRWVENKYRIRLNFFSLVLIDGIIIGILVMLIINFYFSKEPMLESELIRLLIVIGLSLAILILGLALPLRKYLKRRENGEVPPIRIPEKTEEEREKENSSVQNNGHPSIARQIAEMTRELEEKDKQDK